jgi:hypothetical protein
MIQCVLLKLFTIDALYHLRLLIALSWKFLTIITQIVLHCIHILLKLKRLYWSSEVYL